MAIEKPLDPYYDETQVDPDEPDIELFLDQESDYENITEFEDGSVDIGEVGDGADADLPPMDQIPHESNLVAYFEDSDLNEIADNITAAWDTDNESRKEWSETYAKGLDLLGMKIEERDEPFPGASGQQGDPAMRFAYVAKRAEGEEPGLGE